MTKWIVRLFAWTLLTGVAASGIAAADELSDWNNMLLQAMLTNPVTAAPLTPRVAAIVQASVFDAVNGIDRHYVPIYVPPAAPPGTSARAAAVEAAYTALVSLYPAQKAKFDQQLAASMAGITDTPDAVKQGLAWGQSVAQQILTWKSQDGFSDTVAPYLGGTQPGQWRPTPPAMAPGLAPQLATTTPWVIRSPSQFRTAGPPALTSDQYLGDYNETMNMGSATNSGRTDDQTLLEFLAGQQSAGLFRHGSTLACVAAPLLDGADSPAARAGQSGDGGCDDRLLGRQVYLQILAADYGDPTGRHGWQRQHYRQPGMDPADYDAGLSGISFGALLCDRRGDTDPVRNLRRGDSG